MDCETTRELEQEQQDVDFDYEEEFYLSDYDADSDSSNDSSNVQLVKNYGFYSSLCYTQMRSFRLFCGSCKDVFLTYFVNKLHIMSNDIFCRL